MASSPSAESDWKRSWLRRSLLWGTIAAVVLIAFVFLGSAYLTRNARIRLEQMIAKLDRISNYSDRPKLAH